MSVDEEEDGVLRGGANLLCEPFDPTLEDGNRHKVRLLLPCREAAHSAFFASYLQDRFALPVALCEFEDEGQRKSLPRGIDARDARVRLPVARAAALYGALG